jgi:uncharacterized protein (TIRG00374 family)
VIFAFSILLAILLLWWEGSIDDVGPAIRRADRTAVILGLLLYLAGLALLCVRWHILVRMIKGISHAPRAAEAFLTSVVINYAAPVSLAIPSRAALTKRALGLTATETGAVALWEVACDLIVLSIASVIWFFVAGSDASEISDASNGLILLGLVFLAGIVLVVGGAFFVARTRPRLWEKLLHTIRQTLIYPTKRPGEALFALGVTTVYWIGQGAVFWILLDAIGQKPSGAMVLGLMSLPVLIGMISPVPGGAGVREALMLAIARIHDADGATVLLTAVTYRIALFASIPILYLLVRGWLAIDPAPLPASEPAGNLPLNHNTGEIDA